MTASDIHSNASGAPLSGRSVVVTRTAEQGVELSEPLQALGAEVIACPVIAIVDPPDLGPLDRALTHLADYDWIVLTSTNAVDRFFGRLAHETDGAQRVAGARIAVVGKATEARLARYGAKADLVPDDYRAEGLVEAFIALGAGAGWRVLVPRALKAREILPEALRERGATVDVVPVYETVPAEPDPSVIERFRARDIDGVTFTSPSTFRNFVAVLERAGVEPKTVLDGVVTASIGPVTTAAMRARGFEPTIEADPSTMPALVSALVTLWAPGAVAR